MTTRSSPIQVLKAQAAEAARRVKALGKDYCKFAMVMDDKTLVFEIANVQSVSEKALTKYILDYMQESKRSL